MPVMGSGIALTDKPLTISVDTPTTSFTSTTPNASVRLPALTKVWLNGPPVGPAATVP